METEENGTKNIGHLKSSKMNVVKNQRASLTTVSSFKPICCHDVRINDFLFDRLSKPGRYCQWVLSSQRSCGINSIVQPGLLQFSVSKYFA